MAAIVLAVAKGAHAVLPRLAPVDAGQGQQDAAGPRQRCRSAPFQAMPVRPVVMDAGRQSRQFRADQVALGGVQVAAGRIAAQGPAGRAIALPRRQAEGQLQQMRNAVGGQFLRRYAGGAEQVAPADRQLARQQRQLQFRRAGVAAERIGLRRPVQAARAGSIAVHVVLGPLVVGANGIHWPILGDTRIGRCRLFWRPQTGIRRALQEASGSRPMPTFELPFSNDRNYPICRR